ncbi:putative disease resistance protein [Gossypium australe]|uniref:Putative disease resistance protein n=1 Tax=Gossypium australe TaxID=47621 RepID=A0A5B6U6Q9_9ROSI|nr:putative disease resistance protein [Gossypium australe]
MFLFILIRLSTKMAEYVAPVAAKIVADKANKYASPYFGYFFSYEKIVKDFTNERNALKLRKQRVDTDVRDAKNQTEVIYEDVEDWLRRAKQELEETQNLQDEIDRVKCFKWCAKWGWRYGLSKKLAEKTPIISKLLETSNFAQVGYRRSLQGIEFITSTDFMDSESSKSALNQIMEAIKVVNMIGLHGMPGVGKTTLAKEVGKHAREQKLFEKVVMFTMSQNPNIRTIQDKVAEMFGLNFRTNTEEGRAEELWSRLKVEKHILIIIDDLWDEFKLESIGIPFGDDHKGCKILLTTRQQQVCSKMKCQKEIQLGILSKDEAWVLFRDQAGLDDDWSSLNEVAKEVAGECKGLPLAIVTVAKALKDKSLDEWRDANQRFKDSTHLYDEEVLGGVLEPLKLSYDYLKKGNNQMTGNHIQMCFLLCSLFPEDAEIPIHILIVCGIGVGLFPNASSIEDKRKRIGEALKKIQKSGLLLETDGAERIRMHDVVRDFAHWLTSTGENRFMVKDKLKEWPDMVESFEGYTAIALWNCSSNIKNFPDKVEFSKLKTLFLQGESKWDGLLVVSSTFFEEMKALQVLKLEGVYFSLKGFNSLPNLKTLWCENCKLENLSSSLTSMRSLEILALIATKIDEISEELVKLSALKYLRLYDGFASGVMKIPPKLVSRYDIVVGGLDFSFGEELTIRRLRIENFSSSLSAFKNLFCNVGELKLRKVSGLKNIVPSIGKKVLNELTSLELDSCNDMEFLTDITRDQESTITFSNLVELTIRGMVSLKGLCYSLSPSHRAIASYTILKVVTIGSCPKLKTIFSPCLAQSMLCIEELYIRHCSGLEQVIGFAQEEEITKNDSRRCCCPKLRILEIFHCKSLKYVCANTLTQGLQSLESVKISDCPQLMQIFKMEQNENGEDVAVPQLLNCKKLRYIFSPTTARSLSHLVVLTIEGCEEIEQLILAKGQVSSSSSNGGLQPISFPNLTNATITNCRNLKSLFPFGSVPVLPKLECLEVKSNSKLEQVFELVDESKVVPEEEMEFDQLRKLSLKELPSLIHFGLKGYHFVLSALEDLKVRNCPKLTTSFSIDSQEFVHCKTKV